MHQACALKDDSNGPPFTNLILMDVVVYKWMNILLSIAGGKSEWLG